MEGYKNILANKFMRDTNYIIIKDTDSLEDLEYQWNKFLSNMTTRQQRLSDDKSIEIWNMTNQQHYMDLKIRLSNGENKDVESTAQDAEEWQEVPEYMFNKIPENDIDRFNLDDTIQEGRIPLNYDVKFVARTETQDNIERAEKICAETNINMIIMYKGDSIKEKLEDLEKQYEKWQSQSFDLRRKSDDMCREIFKMTNIDRYNKFKADPTDKNKQSLLELGWNPEVDLNSENLASASKNIRNKLIKEFATAPVINLSILNELETMNDTIEYIDKKFKELAEDLLNKEEFANIEEHLIFNSYDKGWELDGSYKWIKYNIDRGEETIPIELISKFVDALNSSIIISGETRYKIRKDPVESINDIGFLYIIKVEEVGDRQFIE